MTPYDGLVWVVSRAFYEDERRVNTHPTGTERVWYDDEQKALDALFVEVRACYGREARIRLVPLRFPTYGLVWTDEAITALVEDRGGSGDATIALDVSPESL